MTRSFPAGTPNSASVCAPPLGVDNDALEASEHAPPQLGLVGRPARQQVVCRQDERRTVAEQPGFELRRGEPLQVDDVGTERCQPGEAERVLERFHRQPQA